MSLLGAAKRMVERLTGTRIHRSAPRGVDLVRDIQDDLPAFRLEVVFDVGANVGQSARQFLGWSPTCRIHCFEPTRATFEQLRQAVEGSGRVGCHRLALGAASGVGRITLQESSTMNSVAAGSSDAERGADPAAEHVEVATLDDFCAAQGVDHISFLKVDTEGGDLDVLRGSEGMLVGQRVDIVQVEAGMNPGNDRHVPLEALKAFLEPRGYLVFGLYEQVSEWPAGEPQLRRTNPVFISRRTIEANRRATPARRS